jgi:hypothetical protein
MAWHLHLDVPNRVLHLTMTGRVGADDIQACAIEGISLLRQHGTSNLLADVTGVTQADLSSTTIFDLPGQFQSLGLDRPLREAIVMTPDSPIRDAVRFYETVLVNRGHAVRVFHGHGEALAWLAQEHGTRAARR